MAEKKSEKSSKKSAPAPVSLGIGFGTFFVICFILYILIMRYYPAGTTETLGETARNFWLIIPDYLTSILLRLYTFSMILSFFLVIFIIWASVGVITTRRAMHRALILPEKKVTVEEGVAPPIINEKWGKVLIHINSANQNDWKLAILECDIMLSDILEKLGYMQDSIGEKLKAVDTSKFRSIEAAWEAHKIRNQIAHEGSDFLINEREAKRVIGLYETVFREFNYIDEVEGEIIKPTKVANESKGEGHKEKEEDYD